MEPFDQPNKKISIHALREESDVDIYTIANALVKISIHALREESDFQHFGPVLKIAGFQSTPSARRATYSA